MEKNNYKGKIRHLTPKRGGNSQRKRKRVGHFKGKKRVDALSLGCSPPVPKEGNGKKEKTRRRGKIRKGERVGTSRGKEGGKSCPKNRKSQFSLWSRRANKKVLV